MNEMSLSFYELFSASPHVFLKAKHPLAEKESVTLKDLQAYPRLNFLQGSYESAANHVPKAAAARTFSRTITVK
jgi:hypothetical protein